MVGSHIFIVSSYMELDAGSAGWLMAGRVLTALITVAAALSYIELSTLFPKAGGTYIYLKEAYNLLIGFLYGWSFFAAILTSDAWYGITFIAGEVKNSKRNVGLALFLGTLIVTTLYCLCNVMYLAVLPLGNSPSDATSIAFAPDNRVGVTATLQIFGAKSALVVAALIMLSNLGCNNGLGISGAPVYYAIAKDGLFFKSVGRLNKAAVPVNGIWHQCLVAILLCLSGSYGDLPDYISFVVMLFYIITFRASSACAKKCRMQSILLKHLATRCCPSFT